MSDNEITCPVVHSNGTPINRLEEGYDAMLNALEEAIKILNSHSPNPRDYYPKPGSYDLAINQHRQRVLALFKVRDSIQTEYLTMIARNESEDKKR